MFIRLLAIVSLLLIASSAQAQTSTADPSDPGLTLTVQPDMTICRTSRRQSEVCDRREALDPDTLAASRLSLLESYPGYVQLWGPELRELTIRYIRHADRTIECQIVGLLPAGEMEVGNARIPGPDPRMALTWSLASWSGLEPPSAWLRDWHPDFRALLTR